MSRVLKISLPGIDVKTARPDQCVVHSDYANPKINKHANPAHRGLITFILNGTYVFGNTTLYSFAHGYPYTPMVWATISQQGTNSNIFGFQPYVKGFFELHVTADSSNINFIAEVFTIDQSSVTPLVTLNISYAIFADNGAKA